MVLSKLCRFGKRTPTYHCSRSDVVQRLNSVLALPARTKSGSNKWILASLPKLFPGREIFLSQEEINKVLQIKPSAFWRWYNKVYPTIQAERIFYPNVRQEDDWDEISLDSKTQTLDQARDFVINKEKDLYKARVYSRVRKYLPEKRKFVPRDVRVDPFKRSFDETEEGSNWESESDSSMSHYGVPKGFAKKPFSGKEAVRKPVKPAPVDGTISSRPMILDMLFSSVGGDNSLSGSNLVIHTMETDITPLRAEAALKYNCYACQAPCPGPHDGNFCGHRCWHCHIDYGPLELFSRMQNPDYIPVRKWNSSIPVPYFITDSPIMGYNELYNS